MESFTALSAERSVLRYHLSVTDSGRAARARFRRRFSLFAPFGPLENRNRPAAKFQFRGERPATMFRIPAAGGLLGASRASAKLFTPSSGFGATAATRLREIRTNKVGDKLIIEAVKVPSPREGRLIPNNSKCCSLCSLNLDVKHTDVLILSQFVRPDGCMLPQRITGLCKTQQKRMSTLVSMSHKAGLLSSLAPANSKKDPSRRKEWKKYNTYFDESTIKIYDSHFTQIKKDIILNYMKSKKQENQ